MNIYEYDQLSREDLRRLCVRNPLREPALEETCEEIFREVEAHGDEAVRAFTRRFDGVELSEFRVQAKDFQDAVEGLSPEVTGALQQAAGNIRKFHSAQSVTEEPVVVQEGVTCWRAARAISGVGIYVPGGTAVMPSTVLMLGIPAKLAGCQKVLLCTPPRKDGSVPPVVLAAAQIAGIRQVYRVGGAQAVAAMAVGTETIPKVEKILGPGNRYVQTAKLLAAFRGVSVDMVAGPTEVLIIADQSASPRQVAADLIAQAEHGADSRAILVTTSSELLAATVSALDSQLEDLPRRELARESLDRSFALRVSSLEKAFDFGNRYAPEHLVLALESPREWLGCVQSAGSVFVGHWSPEVAGDYASGTNHTLPTSGTARSVSGVSMDSFVKKITFQELTATGLEGLAPTLETLAREENLEGHARAVRFRLEGKPGAES
jgi:histidinol dehydrogenase